MRTLARTFDFVGFTLLEYLRSGRIIAEVLLTAITFYVFLRRTSSDTMSAEYFFTVAALFAPALAIYTVSTLLGLADRPQSYLLLSRRIGRGGFLMGFFLVTLMVVLMAYGTLCGLTALLNPPADLDLRGWALGTLPLLLNVGLLTALLILLSPLVLGSGWRLFVLALIALAFSSNFISGPIFTALPEIVRAILRAAQALFGGPLVPAFYGYQISVTRDYSQVTVWANLLAQASLLMSLLGLALYAFARRDLTFTNN